jgi:hypothetical protein
LAIRTPGRETITNKRRDQEFELNRILGIHQQVTIRLGAPYFAGSGFSRKDLQQLLEFEFDAYFSVLTGEGFPIIQIKFKGISPIARLTYCLRQEALPAR